MRVLHLLAPAPFGGVERVVESLAAEQARAGHDVHVAAVLDEGVTGHILLRSLESLGVHTHALPVAARAYRHERRLIRRLCLSTRPDIVHTHGYRSDVLHGSVARKLGIATVTTSHGFIEGGWKNGLYLRLQRRAFRRTDAVVAVSRPMAAVLRTAGIAEHRLHCIPNGWTDSIRFLDRAAARNVLHIDEHAFCFGFIGRIGIEKGPDTFIDAVAQLDDGAAVLIGDGRLRAGLMERTASRAPSRVAWAGALENAGTLMQAFDVLVLSSRTEGTPIVLLEAMAAGVPVIATRVGGVPDVVSEEEAVLVAPEDSPALAAAMQSVMRDPASARRRAEAATRRLHTEFSAQHWLDRYDHVYRACVARIPVAAPVATTAGIGG